MAGSVQQKHLDDALVYLAATRYNEALTAFDRAAGRISNAIHDFSKVLDLRPNFDQALLQRGKLYLKTCDLEAAIADLSIYVKLYPSNDGASEALEEAKAVREDAQMVQTSLNSGARGEAFERLSRLVTACPLSADYRLIRADLHLASGDKIMAAEDLAHAAQFQPDDTTILTRLAGLQLKIGDTAAAQATIRKCLKRDSKERGCKKMFRELKTLDKAIKVLMDVSVGSGNWGFAIDRLFGPSGGVGDGGIIAEAERVGALEYKRKAYYAACRAYLEIRPHTKSATKAVRWCETRAGAEPDVAEAHCDVGDAQILAEAYLAAAVAYANAQRLDNTLMRAAEGYQRAQRLQRAAGRKDYYKMLGVARTAGLREIRRAYRQLSMEHQVDMEPEAEQKFYDINEAYQVLSDEEKRAQFDCWNSRLPSSDCWCTFGAVAVVQSSL
ncbi:DnaJ sub C member 3 [Cladochytrium tenue]|nr:DnaJ sub C member 3 [Cladochytrium tenue]